jgi:hypothetical protein
MLAALLIAPIAFPGGSANDFAKFLAEQTHHSVVIGQAYVRPVEKANLDVSNFELLARNTRSQTHLRFAPGVEMILQDELLPPCRMGWTTIAGTAKDPKWVDLTGVKDGKVTFHTSGDERVDPFSLEKAGFSRPLTVHWMLGKFPLAIQADGMDEKQFLAYVAKATGGYFVVTAKAFRLELDPDQLRRRASNMLDLSLKNDPNAANPYEGVQARVEFLKAVLQDASRSELAAAFASDKSKVQGDLRTNSETVRTLIRRMKTDKSFDPDTGAVNTPAGPINLEEATKAQFVLEANFHAALQFTFKGEEGKDPPILRMEFGG